MKTVTDISSDVIDLTSFGLGRGRGGVPGAQTLIDPQPGVEGRWQATRCGVVDSWNWGAEQFLFHQGSGAFVGPNGSGKSLNGCMFVPTLTDANISEKALSVSGQSGARLSALHLGNKAHGPREGMWWHEYGFIEPGTRKISYFTIGQWMHKPGADTGRLQRAWFVVEDARIDTDLHLQEDGHAVGIVRLAEQLEILGGRLFTSADPLVKAARGRITVIEPEDGYATAVRQTMYSPFTPDQLTALTGVQRTLRGIRVGDDKLPHDYLAKVLTSALPGLAEGPVRELADVLTRTGNLEQRLDQARRERDLLSEVAIAYRTYAGAQAAALAAALVRREAEYRRAQNEEMGVETRIRDLQAAERREHSQVTAERDQLGLTDAEIQTVQDTLAQHPGARLDHLASVARDVEEIADQYEQRALADSEQAVRERARLQSALTELGRAREALRESLDSARSSGAAIGAGAHHAGLDELCTSLLEPEAEPIADVAARAGEFHATRRVWIAEREQDLDALAEAITVLNSAVSEHHRAAGKLEELELVYTDMLADAERQRREFDEQHGAATQALERYLAGLIQLAGPEAHLLSAKPLDPRAWDTWVKTAHAASVGRIDAAGAQERSDTAAETALTAGMRQSAASDQATQAVGVLLAHCSRLHELLTQLPTVPDPLSELAGIAADVVEANGGCDPDRLAAVETLREACASIAVRLLEEIDSARDALVKAIDARAQAAAQAAKAQQVAHDARRRIDHARTDCAHEETQAQLEAQSTIACAQDDEARRSEAAMRAEAEAIAEANSRADSLITQARQVADTAQRNADAAEAAALQAETAWLAAVHRWFEHLRVLPSATLPRPQRSGRNGFDPEALGTAVAGAHLTARLRLGEERNSAHNDLGELETREGQLLEEIQQARQTDPRPAAPFWRADRAGRPGAPFWELVDFAEGTDPAVRNHIEGALLAAGLLDAWVSEDGAIDAGDTYLRPRPAPAGTTTLASYLVPDASEHVTPEAIRAILASIQVTGDPEHGIEGLLLTEDSGEIRTGLIHARAPHGWQSRYIGATARARARQALLDALNQQLQDLQEPLSAAREHLAALEEEITTADEEADALPPSRDMLITATGRDQARTAAERAAADAERCLLDATTQRDQEVATAHDRREREVADAQREREHAVSFAQATRTSRIDAAHQAMAGTIAAAQGDERAAREEAENADNTAHILWDQADEACRAIGIAAELQALAPLKSACAAIPRAVEAVAGALARAVAARDEADQRLREAEEATENQHAALAHYVAAQEADHLASVEREAFPGHMLEAYDALRKATESAELNAEMAFDAVRNQRKEAHARLTQRKEAEARRNAAASVGGTQPAHVTTTARISSLRNEIGEFSAHSDAAGNAAASTSQAVARAIERRAALESADQLAIDSAASAANQRRTANEKWHAYHSQKSLHDLDYQQLNDRLTDLRAKRTRTQAAVEHHQQAQSDARAAAAAANALLTVAVETRHTRGNEHRDALEVFYKLFDLDLIADLAGGQDIPRPDDDQQALDAAGRIIAERGLPGGIDPKTADGRAATALSVLERAIRIARELLMGLGRTVDAAQIQNFPWHQVMLSVLGTGGGADGPASQPLPSALADLEGRIAKLEDDFTEQLQTKFKEYITGDLRKHINERIMLAGDIVNDIKNNLEKLRTGVARVGVRLKWSQRKDALSKRAIDLIQGANSEGNFKELFDFFMNQLKQEGSIGDAEGRVEEVFDYRNWYEWTIEITHVSYSEGDPNSPEVFKQITKQRNPLNELSAGEKRLVTMLPLLAALRAFYSADGYCGPRTVFIDELNAAFDTANLRQVLNLLRSWDLDVLATLPSQAPLLTREIGAIAINKLTETTGGIRINTPSIWDGRGPTPLGVLIAVGATETA